MKISNTLCTKKTIEGDVLLADWFSGRPKWLQKAANCLLENGDFKEEDIINFAELCCKESLGEIIDVDCNFPEYVFNSHSNNILHIKAINNIEGVNALAPQKALEFAGKGISVIYGNNGSGKSGYVRLLKHICGTRNMGALHQNVYKPIPSAQKATITCELNGVQKIYDWTGQGHVEELQSLDVFDTSFGRFFLSNEEEVSYEPPVLLFFSSLIQLCEKVSGLLETKASQYSSQKITLPIEFKNTPEGIWFNKLFHKTSSEEINRYCIFSDEDTDEYEKLSKRLLTESPLKQATELRKKIGYKETLLNWSREWLDKLSIKKCNEIIELKKKYLLRKNTAETVALKTFNNECFEGMGTEVWKTLWEAAREYSEKLAYKDYAYPNVTNDARCVLCHQILSSDAKERFISFDNFIKDKTESAVVEAKKNYDAAISNFQNLPSQDILKAKSEAAQLPENISIQICEFFSILECLKNNLTDSNLDNDIIFPDFSNLIWIQEIEKLSNEEKEMVVQYDNDAKNDRRKELEDRLLSLKTKRWLSEHLTLIQEEYQRVKFQEEIKEAKKLSKTDVLSKKKGELADVLISDAFAQRFNQELKKLGASHIQVELVKAKVLKGRVLHKLQLKNVVTKQPLTEILSEGENRIISLAAFLADAMGKNSQTPFIFDDPISSLDQNYEESVAQRLIELSHNRQIIIFTHRLSLLGIMRHCAKRERESVKLDIICIRSTDQGKGEPTLIPITQDEITKALNRLINDRYKKAKNASDANEFDGAETYIKSICSDFRIIIERVIENDLLCGIVQRFQRAIHTQQIKELQKLKNTDLNFLDTLMSKYSTHEHSQSIESPVSLPTLAELLNDMKTLLNWRNEYSKRKMKLQEEA